MAFLTSRALVGALAAAVLCAAAHAQTAPVRPPAADFFGNAPFSHPSLSPNGKLLAVVVSLPGKRDALAVINLADNHVYSTANFAATDVSQIRWVNDERLVFDTDNKQLGQRDSDMLAPGLYAVNYDGTHFRQLAAQDWGKNEPSSIQSKMLPWHTFLSSQEGPQKTDTIYVENIDYDIAYEFRSVRLVELNTVTGQSKEVERPGDTQFWRLDNEGVPRLAIVRVGADAIIYFREPGQTEWKKLDSYKFFTGESKSFNPIAFDAHNTLYVSASNGKDKTAIYALNLSTGKMDEQPLISAADYDFDGELIMLNGKLAGARITTDAETTVWFDPKWKQVQDEIDKLQPSTINVMVPAERPETPWVLVQSYSDVQPRIVQLYNTETKTFKRVGASHPAIIAAQMGHQEDVRYKARDGLVIPALLTLPAGAKRQNLPLVVLVHGGPYVRGSSFGWNAQTQFLASRGYAVLEPEFRGSTGFGSKHFHAGWKQWGLGMQNDIADGAKWAVAEGIVDPKRICIAGASYGGYAALMGVVNDPDVFKCAINWIGVTDIELLYKGSWGTVSDQGTPWRKYGMPELVGDLSKDAAQLRATSPLQQAARIKRPLLLAYGGDDSRVPLHHGEKFYKAVKETNPDVEWVVYSEEGHGWYLPKNRIDFWTRVEKFLDRNIGKTQ